MIVINMQKAKEIKKDLVRAERKPLLDALDVEMLRAIESNNLSKQAEIAAKKQALRDATVDPSIIDATTPEELKAAIPAVFLM